MKRMLTVYKLTNGKYKIRQIVESKAIPYRPRYKVKTVMTIKGVNLYVAELLRGNPEWNKVRFPGWG